MPALGRLLAALALLAAAPALAQPIPESVSYGPDARQGLDVFVPQGPGDGRPILVMLHGGGWDRGGRRAASLWRNQTAHWLPLGYVYVTVGTRLLPDADPLLQARDLSRAVAAIQDSAARWGADPAKLVLIGHSSGGHVAALMAAQPELAPPDPLAGVVTLDSGYLDVPHFMSEPRQPVFGRAFGDDPGGWAALSPAERLTEEAPPFLLVCSLRSRACTDNARFAQRAAAIGVPAEVLPVARGHMEVLEGLGEPSTYTYAVGGWIARQVAAATGR